MQRADITLFGLGRRKTARHYLRSSLSPIFVASICSRLTHTAILNSAYFTAAGTPAENPLRRRPFFPYAVSFHGYHRATDDLGVWISPDAETAAKVSAVFQEFARFPAEQVPSSLFMQRDKVFIFGREPVRIDVLTGPSGVKFEECFARRSDAVLDGVRINIISLRDLKLNKAASGRTKDLADLDNLPSDLLTALRHDCASPN